MKKLLSLVLLIAVMAVAFAGCGKSERLLYNVKLEDYIKLGEYKDLTVDTKSDDYIAYYNAQMDNDIQNQQLYAKLNEGKVQKNDIANIDYVGKKDGVAFEGGTADGYDLTIGSGSFIEGFEDGLIGVEIGSTVDLNLTFPENYGNEELNGAAVVFTVKVNYVQRAKEPKDYCKDLGFKSLEEYEDDLKKRAAKECLIDMIVEKTKITKYSENDVDTLYNFEYEQMNTYYTNNYGMGIESVLSSYGMTAEDFKNDLLENSIYPQSKEQMVLYAIMDEEKISVTQEDIDKYIDKMVAENEGVDRETLKEYYEDFYFEALTVTEKVSDFLYESNKVK